MQSENPYQVTTELEHSPVAEEANAAPVRRTVTSWIIVFLLNLPVCVLFGASLFSSAGGYAGMFIGCVLWCGLGILLCFGNHIPHVRATARGGLLVALSQFYPLLQMFAGTIAAAILESLFNLGGSDGGPLNIGTTGPVADMAVSTAMTLLTGGMLIIVAFTGGHIITLIVNVFRENR